MKNIKLLIVLFIIIVHTSCSNEKKMRVVENHKAGPSKTYILQRSKDTVLNTISVADGSVNQSELQYFFSNDKLCQTLSIEKVGKAKIPEALKFKLVLRDKLGKYAVKEFSGLATLFSSQETFYDSSNEESADYFAGDYIFASKYYEIQIRVDIQDYEASVVAIRSTQLGTVLGGYTEYLMKFPDQGVMKRGRCTN